MSEKTMSFEEAMKGLKEMTDMIRSPETNLEKSISCYKEGMKYYEICSEMLAKAEQSIETVEMD